MVSPVKAAAVSVVIVCAPVAVLSIVKEPANASVRVVMVVIPVPANANVVMAASVMPVITVAVELVLLLVSVRIEELVVTASM